MRGKRSKQYRKLMQQYALTFNFREPYQVLVDAGMVQDSTRFAMELQKSLKRTLHGEVKPMITTCSMRHLYAEKDQKIIEIAKSFERRRCNHHELEEPLSSLECLKAVVDGKGSGTNKHRYVVASQDKSVRAYMRDIPGIPLVYIARSVMILEPMAETTSDVRLKEERSKFRQGLKTRTGGNSVLGKRAREDEEQGSTPSNGQSQDVNEVSKRKKKQKGPKGVNPLSMLKPKRRENEKKQHTSEQPPQAEAAEDTGETVAKKKRIRKPSKKTEVEVTPIEAS